MKTSIVKIGNSRGIRIPKPVIDQCHFKDEVEMEVRDGDLVIYSASKIRNGWDDAFRDMACRKDDRLLDDISASSAWDDKDWQW